MSTETPTVPEIKVEVKKETTEQKPPEKKHPGRRSGKPKLYTCSYPGCTYTTVRPGHIRRHERIHTREKPFQCQYCDYCASRSDHLKRHLKVHMKYTLPREPPAILPVPIATQTIYPTPVIYDSRPTLAPFTNPAINYYPPFVYQAPIQSDAELFYNFIINCRK
ncbi:hypothetical protein WA158_002788 [Blastocystis sp. Blastoise]